MAAYDELDAAFDKAMALSLDALTHAELLALLDRQEALARRLPAAHHTIISRLAAEADPKALGGTSLADVVCTRLRISMNDAERARRRHLTIHPQSSDGMSKISGLLDPEARATIDAVLAKWAVPGMCNPEDQAACVDQAPSDEHRFADTRSQGQRNHDALKAGYELVHR